MKTIQSWVEGYIRASWRVVPLMGKKPTLPEWPKLTVTTSEVQKYFGNGENVGVILGQRSGGLVDVDIDCPAAIRIAPLFLPKTEFRFGRASKPVSHWIYVSPASATHRYVTAADGCIVELRSTGGQTMFPPSVHPSGETLALDGSFNNILPAPAGITPATLEGAVSHLAVATILGIHWPAKGTRHDASLALAGGLLSAEWARDDVETLLRAVCTVARDEEANSRIKAVSETMRRIQNGQAHTGWKRLSEFVGSDVVAKVREWLKIGSVIVVHDTPAPMRGSFRDTDLGNAERIAFRHSDKLRYVWVGKGGFWVTWDRKRWIESEAAATILAKETVRSVYAEANSRANEAERDRGRKWAHLSESAPRVNAMLELARSEPKIAATPELFDSSPWVLNLQNGYLDLSENPLVLRPHDPQKFVTQITNSEYDPHAICPLWMKTLDRVFGNDKDLIWYLQSVLGYCLTGDVSEQKFWIAWGTGANGKSTILGTVRHILGNYAQQINSATITQGRQARSGDIPRSDLANLRKVRLLSAIELAQGQRLDDSLVKLVTGGELLVARKLYHSEAISFMPEFKLVLACNHKPAFPPDSAMARRIRLIPFTVTIPPNEQDHDLIEKLRAEANGILNFCLKGFHLWHRMSWLTEREPSVVRSATEDYLRELDPLTPFLDECCEVGSSTHRIQASDFFRAYQTFTKSNPEYGGDGDSMVVFARRMQDAGSRLGVEKKKIQGRNFWCGIRLKSEIDRESGQPKPAGEG